MKLVRYGQPGAEKPGLVDSSGVVRDLSGHVADIDGSTLSPESLARLAAIDPATLPVVEAGTRLGCPVGNVGKLLCVGLNYTDHAEETGQPIPYEPVLFMKATTAICGPNDNVVLPRDSVKGDWEVELGIVIGSRASYVEEADALDHVAGYCLVNDVSERQLQLEGTGQWVKGKSADTFAPSGPWVATKDEIPDPGALDMWLEGRRAPLPGRQHAHHDLRREDHRELREPPHDPDAGRRHPHRHPARGRRRPEAAGVPEARQRHAPRHRRAGRAAPGGGGVSGVRPGGRLPRHSREGRNDGPHRARRNAPSRHTRESGNDYSVRRRPEGPRPLTVIPREGGHPRAPTPATPGRALELRDER